MKAMQVGGSSVQQALIRLIFKAYMEEEQDIADIGNLSEMAECAGVMSKNEVIVHVFIFLVRPVRHRLGCTRRARPPLSLCACMSRDDVSALTEPFLQAVAFLKSDECLAQVEQQVAEAREKGVTGVPFTIIDGKWAVSGGQTADVFVKVRYMCFLLHVCLIFLVTDLRKACTDTWKSSSDGNSYRRTYCRLTCCVNSPILSYSLHSNLPLSVSGHNHLPSTTLYCRLLCFFFVLVPLVVITVLLCRYPLSLTFLLFSSVPFISRTLHTIDYCATCFERTD